MGATGLVGNTDREKKGVGCHLHEGAAQGHAS